MRAHQDKLYKKYTHTDTQIACAFPLHWKQFVYCYLFWLLLRERSNENKFISTTKICNQTIYFWWENNTNFYRYSNKNFATTNFIVHIQLNVQRMSGKRFDKNLAEKLVRPNIPCECLFVCVFSRFRWNVFFRSRIFEHGMIVLRLASNQYRNILFQRNGSTVNRSLRHKNIYVHKPEKSAHIRKRSNNAFETPNA